MKNLQLADDQEGPEDIQMLIGLDNYWRVITGGTIRGKDGPVAVASKFGYILSGPVMGVGQCKAWPSVNLLVDAAQLRVF